MSEKTPSKKATPALKKDWEYINELAKIYFETMLAEQTIAEREKDKLASVHYTLHAEMRQNAKDQAREDVSHMIMRRDTAREIDAFIQKKEKRRAEVVKAKDEQYKGFHGGLSEAEEAQLYLDAAREKTRWVKANYDIDIETVPEKYRESFKNLKKHHTEQEAKKAAEEAKKASLKSVANEWEEMVRQKKEKEERLLQKQKKKEEKSRLAAASSPSSSTAGLEKIIEQHKQHVQQRFPTLQTIKTAKPPPTPATPASTTVSGAKPVPASSEPSPGVTPYYPKTTSKFAEVYERNQKKLRELNKKLEASREAKRKASAKKGAKPATPAVPPPTSAAEVTTPTAATGPESGGFADVWDMVRDEEWLRPKQASPDLDVVMKDLAKPREGGVSFQGIPPTGSSAVSQYFGKSAPPPPKRPTKKKKGAAKSLTQELLQAGGGPGGMVPDIEESQSVQMHEPSPPLAMTPSPPPPARGNYPLPPVLRRPQGAAGAGGGDFQFPAAFRQYGQAPTPPLRLQPIYDDDGNVVPPMRPEDEEEGEIIDEGGEGGGDGSFHVQQPLRPMPGGGGGGDYDEEGWGENPPAGAGDGGEPFRLPHGGDFPGGGGPPKGPPHEEYYHYRPEDQGQEDKRKEGIVGVRGREPYRDQGEINDIGALASRSVDPNAFNYRYHFKDNLDVMENMKKRKRSFQGTNAERANMGAGQYTGYRGPYNYPELDDTSLKLLGGFKNVKTGNASQLWQSMTRKDGSQAKRGRYFKWSGKKQLWQMLRTQREAKRFLSRANRKPDRWRPLRIPAHTMFSQYMKNISRFLGAGGPRERAFGAGGQGGRRFETDGIPPHDSNPFVPSRYRGGGGSRSSASAGSRIWGYGDSSMMTGDESLGHAYLRGSNYYGGDQ